MKSMRVAFGLVLVVVGAAVLGYWGLAPDPGGVSPVAGGIALVSGLLVLVAAGRRPVGP